MTLAFQIAKMAGVPKPVLISLDVLSVRGGDQPDPFLLVMFKRVQAMGHDYFDYCKCHGKAVPSGNAIFQDGNQWYLIFKAALWWPSRTPE